ncbi:glycosyl hydrolase [Maribellus maritimus]|uniref:glycosyl hydrolase n=1 Tax=Maribellus maritimus TaxID=2870838 RepID=UPI001EEBF8B8|nr:glycosyl hydrolase [Maribellus maritimus]MCG6187334.1 hypothetical protein [Maribellus maritimus]
MNKKNRGLRNPFKITGIVVLLFIFSCTQKTQVEDDTLFAGFVNPPAEARPFVRWWWNGNCLEKDEIIRQLDILKKAGIGGVEINPIAMPEEATDIGVKPMTWLSPEWNDMLKFAAEQAKERGMIADLIVGSGWPFGGEFLSESETMQRMIKNTIPCSGGQRLNETLEDLYKKAEESLSRSHGEVRSYEMAFIRLIPVDIKDTSEEIDLFNDKYWKTDRLEVTIPSGKFNMVYGILQRGTREVMHGAPGAAGPVMNHYEKKITRAYLSRLEKISKDTGTPLSELIRALFCDSIELDGSNWTNNFQDIFFENYHYDLSPWLPFVFYDPFKGYVEENYDADFAEQLKRVRYDYNKLLVKVFLENFTQEFQNFCTEEGVLCRYQAYGTPFLMGMMEGNMIADIPESNNWIYSTDMDADAWYWNQQHGYMIWNLYAASGGHLKGRKIISNEAMTNTSGVFKTSLEEIKQHDDMNFITGMNHSVLHGYNYSPQKAGFPGWIRYGAYFNEKNTWWPFFSKWVDYNARLSFVFQNSQAVKDIAILAPAADIWAKNGLTRDPFHTRPWYVYRLWESLSQTGGSCDYISQKIIQEGKTDDGKLSYGPMSFETIFLSSIESLEPETATALLEFVKSGGKLVAIDGLPFRSLSFQNATQNDSIVKAVFTEINDKFPDQLYSFASPNTEEELLSWTIELLEKANIQKDVNIQQPDKNVFQIHKKTGEKDIWFFTNINRTKTVTLNTVFPTSSKTPWIWNPENGERRVFPFNEEKNELTIELKPLQSLLLVFEPKLKGKPTPTVEEGTQKVASITGPWQATFEPVNGETFTRKLNTLFTFDTPDDRKLNDFAGTVIYSTSFNSNDTTGFLELGKTNKGISEVFLNGESVGLNWYGKPVFQLDGVLKKGENQLEIKYTTVLANYVMSMKDSPTAQRWTRRYQKIPIGLAGEVVIYSEKKQ